MKSRIILLLVLAMMISISRQLFAQSSEQSVSFAVEALKQPGIRTMYAIMVKVGDATEKPLLLIAPTSDRKFNMMHPPLVRANVVVKRLQDAWTATQDKQKLASALDVIKNPLYGIWVLGQSADNQIPGIPSHIVQANGVLSYNRNETEQNALKLILKFLQDDLQGIDSSTKAPVDKTLDDQKRIGMQAFVHAGRYSKTAQKDLEYAISCDPELYDAYESLAAVYDLSEKDKADAVRVAMGKLDNALKCRLDGDDAWDAGDYKTALQKYQQASNIYPKCISYYWLQSLTSEKQGDKSQAIQILIDARTKLGSTKVIEGTPIGAGNWGPMFTARINKLEQSK